MKRIIAIAGLLLACSSANGQKANTPEFIGADPRSLSDLEAQKRNDSTPCNVLVDPTECGRIEYGDGPHGRQIIRIDGRLVPDHFDHDVFMQSQADKRGVPLEQLKQQWTDVKQRLDSGEIDIDGENDMDPSGMTPLPATDAGTHTTASHHPTYQYGLMGSGTNMDPLLHIPRGSTSCTCDGAGGIISSPNHFFWSCQAADSGNHTTPQCLFPRQKSFTFNTGSSVTWGDQQNSDYIRARVLDALGAWGTAGIPAGGWSFTESPIQSANLAFHEGFGVTAGSLYLGYTGLAGTIGDEGDLPVHSGGHTAKALSYFQGNIYLNPTMIETISGQETAALIGFNNNDFVNAYKIVISHELGHFMGVVHVQRTSAVPHQIMEIGPALKAVNALASSEALPPSVDYSYSADALSNFTPNSFSNSERQASNTDVVGTSVILNTANQTPMSAFNDFASEDAP